MADKPSLRLYNTLARAKEDFVPIDPENVRMYVCGPTVYDFAHIGNARPLIVFDVLFRLLRHHYGEDHVTYVRNITDVDDKINARARRDYPELPLNDAIRAVTEKTEKQFRADAGALGCLEPTFQPRATDFVLPRAGARTDMVSLIQSLIDRGHAYEAQGEILFDVASMADYGKLSNRRLEDQQAGARVAVDAHKKNPGDFVLWKQSSDDEPGWDATFTLAGAPKTIRGRPGWHIECSAMSAAYLGETFDIHGGGLDLIFPHHENEIAQSRCAHGTDRMANVWMHNGFLQVEGRKMAKSEGNFVTIDELLNTERFGGRRWPGEVLRLAMLMTHYREPIDFSVRKLREAEKILRGFKRWACMPDESGFETDYDPKDSNSDFLAALTDDLNTHQAILSLHEQVGRLAEQDAAKDVEHPRRLSEFRQSLALLGLSSDSEVVAVDPSLREKVENNVERRLALIREKNFAEADKIRDDLLAEGIQLKDSKDSETGERVTTWEVRR